MTRSWQQFVYHVPGQFDQSIAQMTAYLQGNCSMSTHYFSLMSVCYVHVCTCMYMYGCVSYYWLCVFVSVAIVTGAHLLFLLCWSGAGYGCLSWFVHGCWIHPTLLQGWFVSGSSLVGIARTVFVCVYVCAQACGAITAILLFES